MKTLQDFSRKIMAEQTFGQWIKSIRESKRMSKTECARNAGVSTSRWWQIETDESRRKDEEPPRIERETVAWVAVGLDVPLNDALEVAGYAPDRTEQVIREESRHIPNTTIVTFGGGNPTKAIREGREVESPIPQFALDSIVEAMRAAMQQEIKPLREEVKELRKELGQKERDADGKLPS